MKKPLAAVSRIPVHSNVALDAGALPRARNVIAFQAAPKQDVAAYEQG